MEIFRVVLLIFGFICVNVEAYVLKSRRSNLMVLDDYNTQALDTEVRKKLILDVTDKAQQTVNYQEQIKLECETSINQTIDQCNACAEKSCGSSASLPASHSSPNVWKSLIPALMDPSVRTGLLVTGIEQTADLAVGLLAAEGPKLVSSLGKLGVDVGKSLYKGSKDIFNKVGGTFEKFGNDIAKLAKTSFNGIKNGVKSIGKTIESGAKSVGNTFKDAGNSIANGFKSIFGKRSDECVSKCPSCRKLDTETQDTEQILTNICGADYLQKQQKIIDETTKMSDFYDWALENTVIEKVEYDPTSIDPTKGVVFTEVYTTVNINGVQNRFKSNTLMSLTDIPSWAKDLAKEIWEM